MNIINHCIFIVLVILSDTYIFAAMLIFLLQKRRDFQDYKSEFKFQSLDDLVKTLVKIDVYQQF